MININLSDKIDNFYDLSESEQQSTLKLILETANSNPESFVSYIQTLPLDEDNNIAVIYEALSKDLGNWSEFFLNELNRILNLARKSPQPMKILDNADNLAFAGSADKFKCRSQFIETLQKEMNNENPAFRYIAVWLLPDFTDYTDKVSISRLRKCLIDPDWRIRVTAHGSLSDLNALEPDDKLSLQDKLRKKMMDSDKFD